MRKKDQPISQLGQNGDFIRVKGDDRRILKPRRHIRLHIDSFKAEMVMKLKHDAFVNIADVPLFGLSCFFDE